MSILSWAIWGLWFYIFFLKGHEENFICSDWFLDSQLCLEFISTILVAGLFLRYLSLRAPQVLWIGGARKQSGRRQWHPTPVLLPGKSHGQGSLVGCSPWVARSQTRLSDFTFTFTFMHWRRKWQPTPVFLPGESQGWRVWWAAVYGVAQSRTWLKWLSSGSSSRKQSWPTCSYRLSTRRQHSFMLKCDSTCNQSLGESWLPGLRIRVDCAWANSQGFRSHYFFPKSSTPSPDSSQPGAWLSAAGPRSLRSQEGGFSWGHQHQGTWILGDFTLVP